MNWGSLLVGCYPISIVGLQKQALHGIIIIILPRGLSQRRRVKEMHSYLGLVLCPSVAYLYL